jgi:hypothetical protein
MPRKLAVAAQIKFRIHEDLRRKIEAEAKRHRCSLSSEATRRLKASFETPPVAQILETIDRQTTLMEDAWLRFAVTPDFLAEVDRLTTAIINQPVRNEFGEELSGAAWTEFVWKLSEHARELRRLRATVDLPLREPGPGVRLQGEPEL